MLRLVCNLILVIYQELETDHNPPVIQAFHGWTSNRANLHSNGTLTMSGVYGNGYLGYSNDHGTAQGVNLHKESI